LPYFGNQNLKGLLYIFSRWNKVASISGKISLLILSLLPSLLMVDRKVSALEFPLAYFLLDIHFQYNGFLIGIFLLSTQAFYQVTTHFFIDIYVFI